jgi:hypothetical protein
MAVGGGGGFGGTSEVVEENMFVTAGDSITLLNSKDEVLKSYSPPHFTGSQ